jgi:hypothetical protein
VNGMTHENDGRAPGEDHDARPLTYNDASTVYNIVTALERHDELSLRELSARTVTRLRERGEFDPQNTGHQLLGESEPLSVAEQLELMATGEVIARHYRHPSDLGHAVKAGATWEQIGDARGQSAEAVRREYRQWAEGQHDLHADMGRFGLDDAAYAEAMRNVSVPTERERRAEVAARAERAQRAEMVRKADAAGIPLLDDLPAPSGAAKAYAATHPVLCAHADQDGAGSHWLKPGETCAGAWPPVVTADANPEAGQ